MPFLSVFNPLYDQTMEIWTPRVRDYVNEKEREETETEQMKCLHSEEDSVERKNTGLEWTDC